MKSDSGAGFRAEIVTPLTSSPLSLDNKVSRTGSGIEDAAGGGGGAGAESAFGGARRKATGASTRRGHPEDPGGGAAARASTSIEIRDTET